MAADWESESDELGLSSEGSDGDDEQVRTGQGAQQDDFLQPKGLAEAGGAVRGGDEEVELQEYAKSMGVDLNNAEESDLRWVVREAFAAPLPASWTEHLDEEGRVYFFNQVTQESSWMHPMDVVYKEVIELVKAMRRDARGPTVDGPGIGNSSASSSSTLKARQQAVQAHLEEVHTRALAQIEGWSGPYASEDGQYYYHAGFEMSSWENPIDEWQRELGLRQRVLYRCLLEQSAAASSGKAEAPVPGEGGQQLDSVPIASGDPMVELPRLQLALTSQRLQAGEVPKSPSSTRSFATARSGRSARSARSPTPVRTKASGIVAAAASPGRGASASSAAAAAARGCNSPKSAAKDESSLLPAAASAAPTTGGSQAATVAAVGEERVPPAAKAVAHAMAAAAAAAADSQPVGEDDEDPHEFTFGRTSVLQLPQFGKVGAAVGG